MQRATANQQLLLSKENVLHRRLIRAKATVGCRGRGRSAVAQNVQIVNAGFKGSHLAENQPN
jgi:hypothetical protein